MDENPFSQFSVQLAAAKVVDGFGENILLVVRLDVVQYHVAILIDRINATILIDIAEGSKRAFRINGLPLLCVLVGKQSERGVDAADSLHDDEAVAQQQRPAADAVAGSQGACLPHRG